MAFSAAHWLQMGRIYATPNAAQMVKDMTVFDEAVCMTMGLHKATIQLEHPEAVVPYGSSPQPTVVCLLNL